MFPLITPTNRSHESTGATLPVPELSLTRTNQSVEKFNDISGYSRSKATAARRYRVAAGHNASEAPRKEHVLLEQNLLCSKLSILLGVFAAFKKNRIDSDLVGSQLGPDQYCN